MAPRLGGQPGYTLRSFSEVLAIHPDMFDAKTDILLSADAAMAYLVIHPSMLEATMLYLLAIDEGAERIPFRWALKGKSLQQISVRHGSKELEREHFLLVGRSERILVRF